MKLLYIAAPYTASTHNETHHNIQQARLMAEYYWRLGYAVICPHLNTSFMSGLINESVFYAGTVEMLKACSHIAFHPRHRESSGCLHEHIVADKRKMTMFYPSLEDFS